MVFKETKMAVVLLICLIVSLHVRAQTERRLDSIMKLAHLRGIFNGNVLVAKKGKIIYQASFGYARGHKSKKLTSELLFDIGSVSKEFNGTAIMILKERGLLHLEDPIAKYLPGFADWSRKVKIKNLINYTSGIPIFDPLSLETDSLIQVNLMSLKTLNFEPGTAYLYNHYNVYLQMRIVEKVSGMRYADFISKAILGPCGMTSSLIDVPADSEIMARAFNNEYEETPYLQGMTGWVRLPILDLYRWTECLHSGRILSKESLRELSYNFPGGESSLGTTGFENGELVWHQHQGSNSNYEAFFYCNVKDSISIVLTTNQQQLKVYAIKSALLEAIKGTPVTVPKKSVYLEIRERMLADLNKGLAYYNQLKAERQDVYDFSNETADMINTGRFLLRRHKFDEAIRLFSIAARLGGRSGDVSYAYELTADCYLKKGDRGQALVYYRKALDADAGNKNAEGMLATLFK
jgi:CubicO group peptidase (beta-lactamase class C family)